jgi:predicted AAA+ superfamily ATPase
MTKAEVFQYLQVGRTKSVCVDISLVPENSSLVRHVQITHPTELTIEFLPFGFDEGGVIFKSDFESFDDMRSFLEEYLGQPFAAWHNYTKSGSYPSAFADTETNDQSWAETQEFLRRSMPERFRMIHPEHTRRRSPP